MTGASIRRGGQAVLPTGELIVWSIADGRRGRRWREVVSADGTVVRAVLIESDQAGRLTRLEIATAAGLLTLHPDGEGTLLHGNVVTPAGIRHLTFDRTTVLVDGSPGSAAILVAGMADVMEVGAWTRIELVWLDDRLVPTAAPWAVSRIEPRAWRLVAMPAADGGGGPGSGGGGGERIVRIDEDGLPTLAGDAWPLEI
ncbi:MAG: hypothetical protein M3P84_01355 [Chloroflexota bacterium]|nr:hypothetical protein [Chloroflexota bacterium]